MELGTSIRNRRRTLGWTLEDLARESGVSRAMLSDVERGAKSPTIRVFCQIANALGCPVSELLGEPGVDNVLVTRKVDRLSIRDPDCGAIRQLLSTTLLQFGIELVAYEIPPRASMGPFPPTPSGAVEHITVLEGELCCQVDAQELILKSGDSLTYRFRHTLSLRCTRNETCRMLLLIASRRSMGDESVSGFLPSRSAISIGEYEPLG